MKLYTFIIIIIFSLNSCDLIRILSTTEQKNESTQEINLFLSKRKYHFDYSFENIDSTSILLADSKYRLYDFNGYYSIIQLRIYNSNGNFYSGYSQCLGSFNKNKFIDSLPPSKNLYPYLNTDLKFEYELDLINIDSINRLNICEKYKKYEYIFVVYWTIWTKYYSKHVLREVSKIKRKNPDKVLVIFVNTAKDKPLIEN